MKISFSSDAPVIQGPKDMKGATWYRGQSCGSPVVLYRNTDKCVVIRICDGGDQITDFYMKDASYFGQKITDITEIPEGYSFTIKV